MKNLVVSFSGGESSGHLSAKLKKNYSHKFNLHYIFSNTGKENEQTLEFVDECDKYFGLGVIWVEAVVDPRHGYGIRHKIVNFKTASRNGEPFEAHIAKSGIPNMARPQCSDRLKLYPIESYKKSVGLTGELHAIGIRKDEESRKSKNPAKYNLVYPMCDWFESDKDDVVDYWESMPFRLRLKNYEGNCQTCWKKSDKKLYLIAKEHPNRFEFFDRMETAYAHVKPMGEQPKQSFFRRNRTAKDIIRESELFDISDLRRAVLTEREQDGCSSSCEAYS